MEVGESPGSAVLRTHIHEVHHLAVRRVQERHAIAAPVPCCTVPDAPGIAFGLLQDVLRAYGYFLRFDDAQELSLNEQGIISGAIVGGILLHSMMAE